MPLLFERNQGQADPKAGFIARTSDYTLFLTGPNAIIVRAPNTKYGAASALRMEWLNASVAASVEGDAPIAGKSNYLIGQDATQWHSDIPNYQRVKYDGLYPGIGLVYFGNHDQLEYDLTVAPGADPNLIRLRIDGAKNLRLDKGTGDLLVRDAIGSEMRLRAPVIYQGSPDQRSRNTVSGHYVLSAHNTVSFAIGNYDHAQPLVIDPYVAYSTVFGGSVTSGNFPSNFLTGMAVDTNGYVYLHGITNFTNVPTTTGAFQPACNTYSSTQCSNFFVAKFDTTKSGAASLVYATYLGGKESKIESGEQNAIISQANSLAVDASGDAYITGYSSTYNYPTTTNAYSTTCGWSGSTSCYGGVLSKLNPTGTALLYSTYFPTSTAGGNLAVTQPVMIAVDGSQVAYIAGTAGSGLVTTDGSVGGPSPFIAAFDTTKSGTASLVYSQYLSLNGNGYIVNGIAADPSGNAYLIGDLQPSNNPTLGVTSAPIVLNGFQTTITNPASTYPVLLRLSHTGAITYATLVGSDAGNAAVYYLTALSVDSSGNAYVGGKVTTPASVMNGLTSTSAITAGAYIAKVNTNVTGTASLLYSTFVTANANNASQISALANNGSGLVGFVGDENSGSSNITSIEVNPLTQPAGGVNLQFAGILDTTQTGNNALTFLSFVDGVEALTAVSFDPSGDLIVGGLANIGAISDPFLSVPASFATTEGNTNNPPFFYKISLTTPSFLTVSPTTLTFGNQVLTTTSASQPVTLTNTGTTAITFTSIVASAEFGETNNCGTSLAASASCTVNVTFTPTATGTQTGTLTLTDSDGSSPQTVGLTGTGIGTPQAVLTPTTVAFASRTFNTTSSAQVIVLSNPGSAALTGIAVSITGANPSVFADTSACGTTLAAGASCNISVTFTPSSPASFSASLSVADNATGSPQTVPLTGNGTPAVTQTAGGTNSTLVFNNAPVGIAAASAQTITASFLIAGYSSLVSPTASLHYGLAYSLGAITCTGSIGSQTCSVPVTFTPNYPGGRRDALFLKVGGTRIETALLYGVGTAPFALIQPGVITQPISSGGYYYTGIVDENGTAYILGDNTNTVFSLTKSGVSAALPINGLNSPRDIGIDGAGVLYIADQTPLGAVITYDTVQGVQGSVPFAAGEFYNQGVAVGNTGNIYLTDSNNIYTVPITGPGTAKTTSVNPANTQNGALIVDSSEDVFDSGYAINELTPAGVQTQVNTTSGNAGIGVDAAGTLYSGRYGAGGVGELPASNYATQIGAVDGTSPVLGVAVGPDGTVYAGDYNSVDKVDRSQGVIAFGEQQGTTAVTQTVSVYNGGNTPLTISGVAVSGTAFATATATSGACVVNQAIAPGSLCQIAVSFTSPHAGIFSGTLTIASNSLNNASTTQTVALSAFTYGVYVTESPNPLNFGNQTVGTTSAPQTITFTNNGDLYSAGIGNPTFSGSGYTVTLGTCFSIAVGSSCTGTVTFSPTAVQSYNGVTATFQAGSSGGGPNQVFTLTLNGAGTAAAAPAVTLLPTSVAFPNQPVGTTSAASTVQLTNSGTAALTITGISITGTNPTAFAETSACGTTLAAGSSCNISVTFTPSSAGAFSASLSVADNAAGSPQTVPLTGNGAPAAVAQLQFNPSQINAIAGTGTISNTATGDGGPALQATFTQPYASAQDQSGNYYVSDYGSNYVRKFTVNGNITAYAGIDGYSSSGFSGDGGLAINAKMNGVEGLAVDAAGNLYIADNVNGRVRKVTASTGIITTFAGSGQGAYVNGAAALSAKLPGPTGLAFDPAGNLYIACGAIVVKVTPAGATSLFAGTGTVGYNGDNILATTAELSSPYNVASDQAGNIYIADYGNSRVRKVNAATGIITTVAGNGVDNDTGDNGPATSAAVSAYAVATDLAGDLFLTTSNGALTVFTIRKVDVNGIITTIAGGGTSTTFGGESTGVTFPNELEQTSVDNNGSIVITANKPAQVLLAGPAGFLQFANQAAGTTSAPQTITFENTGDANLTLSQTAYTASAGFNVTGGTCVGLTTLASGATCTLTVTFSPTSATSYTGTIGVNSSGTIGAQTINLAGTGTPGAAIPLATVSPNPLAFGSVAAVTTQNVTVSNTGTASLTLSNIAIAGTGFTIGTASSNNCTIGIVIAASASCQVAVTLTAAHPGTYSGTLTLTDNSGNTAGTVQSVPLSGYLNGIYLTASPASLAFGSQTVGTTSASQPVIITNNGYGYAATISVSNTYAPFTIDIGTCSASLAVGASCQINVAFSPTTTTVYTNTSIAVAGTGPPAPTNTVSFTVSGTGTAAAAPQATLTPNPLAFPNTIVGTSTTLPITLSNPGSAPLTIAGITVTGTNASSFAQTNTCGGSVGVGASCIINVTFTPASAAAGLTASISVADNAGGSPQTVALTAAGTSFVANVGTALAAQAVTVFLPAGGTLGSIQALTQGTPNLDFTLASGGTCATGSVYTAGQSCTVNVVFTPARTGSRLGAVLLTSSGGTVLGTTYLPGTGNGPQVVFGPGVQSTLPAPSGSYSAPLGIAVDAAGNVFVADTLHGYIDKLTLSGGSYSAPVRLSVNGLTHPEGISIDGSGNLWIADTSNSRIVELPWTGSGYGSQATLTATVAGPEGVSVDANGNVFIADTLNKRIVEVPWTGSAYGAQVTVLGTGLAAPHQMAIDAGGDLFLTNSGYSQVMELPMTNGAFGAPVTLPTTNLFYPTGVAVDGGGNVYIANTDAGSVLKLPWNGTAFGTQVVVPFSFGLTANPASIAVDGSGNLYVADGGDSVALKLDVADPPSLSFASTNVGLTSTDSPKTVPVTNIGNASLTFSTPTPNPSYPASFPVNSADTSLCATTLARGASCDVSVKFTPVSPGSLTGSVVLTDNNLNGIGATQSIAVSGTGTGAAAPTAVITPNPDAFPATPVGSSSNSPTPMSLTNSGTGPLTITSIAITGTNASSFSQTNLCSATLAAGASCGITVLFSPTASGPLTANVQVTDNASGSPHLAVLTGTGTVPGVTLNPNPLTFASQQVNTSSAALTATLTNTGGATLHIASAPLSAGDFAESASTCSTQVLAGASCTFSFIFTPTATGARTASLLINDDAPGSPQTLVLNGTGTAAPAPQAVLTASAAFPSTTVGNTATGQTLTLSNPGNAALNITSIVLAGANPTAFGQTNTCGTALAAGASCTINLTFAPTSATSFSATILVTDNVQPQQSATITGTGTAAPAAQAVLTPSTVAFPSTTVSTTSAVQTLTLSNPGNATLTGIAVSIVGANPTDFAQTTTCGATLAASASCTISVTFTPASATTFAATISVANSIATQTATLSGTGTAAPAAQAVLTPTALNFPSTTISSTSAAQTLTLSNPGNATLTGIAVSIAGANPTDFAQTTTCGTTLAASASCTISVTFTPASAATFAGTISVANSIATQTASLTGTGASAVATGFTVVAATPTQTVDPGGTANFNINVTTVTGNFSAPVVLSASGLPANAIASFNPASVIPGTTGAPSVLSVQTAPGYAQLRPQPTPAGHLPIYLGILLPLAGLLRIRRRLRALSPTARLLTLLLFSLAAMLPLTGCGGGYFGPAPQTFTIAVTGTSGAVSHSTTVTLTIQ